MLKYLPASGRTLVSWGTELTAQWALLPVPAAELGTQRWHSQAWSSHPLQSNATLGATKDELGMGFLISLL